MIKIETLARNIQEGIPIKDMTFDNNVSWDFFGAIIDSHEHCTFSNCIFKGTFEIKNLKALKTLMVFENCVFEEGDRQYFISTELFGLNFYKCSFSNLGFSDFVTGDMNLYDCSVKVNLFLGGLKAKFIDIRWESEEKRSKIIVSSEEVEEVQIVSFNNIQELEILKAKTLYVFGSLGKVNIRSKEFETIMLDPYTLTLPIIPQEGIKEVELVYNQIDEIKMWHQSFTGSLKMNELKVSTLSFSNIENSTGIVRLNELEIVKAQFLDVTIKSFYWNQVHFTENLLIERCDFSTLKIANVKWLEGKKVSSSYIDDPVKFLHPLRKYKANTDGYFSAEDIKELQFERETYRQLKAASFANNNNIEGLDFYRNEMRLFWKEIRINGGISVWDRILVFLNRWVSDFGQSWALPLLWLFVFHTLIYFCIIGFNFTMNFEAFRNGAEQYFELLNPVHKTPSYIKGFNVGLELLLRVLDGFFIYHFIRATRKFGKI